MSSTISSRPCSGSFIAAVLPFPNWIEAAEPGGVNCTPRVCRSGLKSMSRRHPRR
jgi:hypothetical protein